MHALIRLLAATASVLASLPLQAAPRVFIGPDGNDANPCTVAFPCRTFQVGINAVDPGGEVVVLDSAGYGTMTIAKAVTVVVPPGLHAGIAVTAGNGVTINAGATDVVVLRGLYVNGTATAADGILFNTGKALYVENVVVQKFPASGIHFFGPGRLSVKDSLIRENGVDGIFLHPVTGSAVATLDRVRLEANGGNGISFMDSTRITATDTLAVGNGGVGFAGITDTAPGIAVGDLERCVAANNGTGISGGGAGSATVRVSNSLITGNATGVAAAGQSAVVSRVNNTLEGNVAGNTFAATYTPK